jgi:hypothetical protein
MSKRKRRRHRPGPPIPPEADELRRAREVIDPKSSFLLELPGGEYFSATGKELLETADAFTALVDAQRSGDVKRIRRALVRLAEL